MAITQNHVINIQPGVSAPLVIHCSQGDTGTQINLTVVNGDEEFDCSSYACSVHGVREDGANFGPFACTLSGSKVTFPLHSEMTAAKGSALAEIVLVDNGGNKVGSANFGILVEQSVFPLGVTYDNDASVYESILAYVQTIPAQMVSDYTSKINEEATARKNAVNAVQNNLDNETNARTSADTLINARIDEIIAPSGQAPSAAEVQDIRVKADGTTAATAGNAVREQITELKSAVSIFVLPLTSGSFLNTSGQEIGTTSVFSTTDYCKFTKDDKFALFDFRNASYSSYSVGYAFYTANKTFISGSGNFDGYLSSDSVSIPQNTAFVRFCTRTGDSPNAKVYVNFYNGYLPDIEALKTGVDGSVKNSDVIIAKGDNLFNPDDLKDGYEIYDDGTFVSRENSLSTDYIDITGNNGTLYITGLPSYVSSSLNSRYMAFYDSSKGVISAASSLTSITSITLTVPNTAKYFAISVYQRADSPASISYSTMMISLTDTSYTPYVQYFGGLTDLPVQSVSKKTTAGKSMLIFGDSITETATVSDDGETYTEGTRINWPTYAKGILDVSSMINFAKSGAGYRDRDNVEARQKLSVQISSAISSGRTGDIIVVSLGTNDTLTNLGSYETAMAKESLASLDKTVLYEAIRWAYWTLKTTYPYAICFAATPIQRADREPYAEVIEAIKKMANRYGFILINGYDSGIIKENNVWESTGIDLYDGLHPNMTGQKKMANLYSSVIMRNIAT